MLSREDPDFGHLTWDGSLRNWNAAISLDGVSIPLHLQDWGHRELSETLEDARELMRNWAHWRVRIEESQTGDLLSRYNRQWREGSDPLEPADFLQRLTANSVQCADSGWRTVNYDHDGLFTDHIIEMRISPDGEIRAVLAG
jgi:hypothetical protein